MEGDTPFLWDMLKYARRVILLTQRTNYAAYSRDWALQMSMERALEVIGEAARKVSLEFRASHPEIPWPSIIGQRNFLAHEYGEVRGERIWQTATKSVPELVRILEDILPNAPLTDTESE